LKKTTRERESLESPFDTSTTLPKPKKGSTNYEKRGKE
jgi:hypothetical protein